MSPARRHRVRRFRSHDPYDWSEYQILQERRWWGWKTIDREEIPAWAVMARRCFGDWGGWKSRFTEFID